jgi:hypothetical protein
MILQVEAMTHAHDVMDMMCTTMAAPALCGILCSGRPGGVCGGVQAHENHSFSVLAEG